MSEWYEDFLGIDSEDRFSDIVWWGILPGLGFIFLPILAPAIFSFLTLQIPQSFLDEQLMRIAVAPVIEEFAFRGVIFSYLMYIYGEWLGLDEIFGMILANATQAAGFMLFHIAVYGTWNSAALLGAFIVGFIFGLIVYKTKNFLSSTTGHLIINWWLLLAGTSGKPGWFIW